MTCKVTTPPPRNEDGPLKFERPEPPPAPPPKKAEVVKVIIVKEEP